MLLFILKFVTASATDLLPFGDNTFDCVLSSLCLCSVPSPTLAIGSVLRVLRPGGTFGFVEHVKSGAEKPFFQLQQTALSPLQGAVAHGCHLDRETGRTVEEAFGAGAKVSATRAFEKDMWPISEQFAGVYRKPPLPLQG